MSPAEVVARFAGSDGARAQQLRRIYSSETATLPGLSAPTGSIDFLTASPGKWRVIELWTLDAVAAPRTA